MNDILNKITQKQKIVIYTTLFFIVCILVIKSFIYPVFETNNSLTSKINQQNNLQQYLLNSQNFLKDNKIFSKLNNNSAKKIIDREFSNISTSLVIAGGNLVLDIKNKNFAKILHAINSLKNNNGIVVVLASINKTNSGLVDAKLTFKFP